MGFWKLIPKILLVKSFVFGALFLVLWGRSYLVADSVAVEVGQKSTSITSARGMIIYRAAADGTDGVALQKLTRRYNHLNPDTAIELVPNHGQTIGGLGFSSHRAPMDVDGGGLVVTITLPHWFLFFIGSCKALHWMLRKYWRKTLYATGETGWCAKCQTDQISNGQGCPRCGSMVINRAFG